MPDVDTDLSDVEVELTEPSSPEEVSSDQASSSSSESESESESEEESSSDDEDLADSDDEEEIKPQKAALASKSRPAAPRAQPARPVAPARAAPAAKTPAPAVSKPAAAAKPRPQLARPAAAPARPAPAPARPKLAPKPASSDEDANPEDPASDSEHEEEEEEAGDSSSESDAEVEVEAAADEDDSDRQPSAQEAAARREDNIRAMLDGTLDIHRKPLLPKLLTVADASATLRRPFKSPHPNAPARSDALKRALAARKQFVPWGAGAKPFQPPIRMPLLADEPAADGAAAAAPALELPEGVEPLILWEPPPGTEGSPVRVDDALTRFLRPHQREGVQFMFECVAGLRGFGGQGCILADDMGLGKTLQGITLLWTLLNSGHEALGGTPLARRIIICCPTSLVSNWDSECTKWLNGRVRTLPLCESSRDDVIAGINQFLSPRCPAQLLILSYETFRIHAERFRGPDACDLLICDEAHRLKNDATQTNKALAGLACRRRVLLSGTPMQNQLQEFYAMVNFCNPGVLGTPAEFRRQYEAPILAGREPDASDTDSALGAERSAALSEIVNEFILRRTNSLLSAHLPPKVVEVVCCRMTPLQYDLYCHFVQSRSVQNLFATQKSARALSAITSLRKLLNHPKLIYDMVHSPAKSARGTGTGGGVDGFEHAGKLFPPGVFDTARGGGLPPGWELLSGKFAVVARMLALLREQTRDRVVIVSNYTQTLDLFAALCRERRYPVLRLDGSTSIAKRQKLVKKFNDQTADEYVFLLSSKAGGCGLNLIGGNRLILFDMSWNPADDKQAAARVWRDGQRRRVYVYRFMTTGTIEEKVYQRQLSKEGLQAVVDAKSGGGGGAAVMTLEELRDLFSYDPDTLSTTYDHMVAAAGVPREKKKDKPPAKRGRPPKKSSAKKKRDEWQTDSEGSEPGVPETEEDSEIVIVDSDSDSKGEDGGSSAEKAATAAAIAATAAHNAMDVDGGKDTPVPSPIPAPADAPSAGNGKALLSAALAKVQGGILKSQVGSPKEEDLASWGHHSDPATVPDDCMALTGAPDVTFIFSCMVDGREVPPDPPLVPFGQGGKAAGGVGGMGASGLGMRRPGGVKPGSAGPPAVRVGSAGPPGVKRPTPLGAPVKRPTPLGPPAKTAPAPAKPAAAAAKPPVAVAAAPPKSAPAPKVAGTKRPSPTGENRAQAAPAPAAKTAPAPKKAPEQAAKRRASGAAPVSAPAPTKAISILYDSDDDFM